MNQNRRKGLSFRFRCFMIQFIIFFEVAVVSWTEKHLSVSDRLNKCIYRMLNSCLSRVVIFLSFLIGFCFIVITCKLSEACESRSVWVDYEFTCVGLCCTLSCQPGPVIVLFSFIIQGLSVHIYARTPVRTAEIWKKILSKKFPYSICQSYHKIGPIFKFRIILVCVCFSSTFWLIHRWRFYHRFTPFFVVG